MKTTKCALLSVRRPQTVNGITVVDGHQESVRYRSRHTGQPSQRFEVNLNDLPFSECHVHSDGVIVEPFRGRPVPIKQERGLRGFPGFRRYRYVLLFDGAVATPHAVYRHSIDELIRESDPLYRRAFQLLKLTPPNSIAK